MKLSAIVNRCLGSAGMKLVRLEDAKAPYANLFDLDRTEPGDMPTESKKLLNLLAYTKTNSSSYNGALYESGYHTIVIDGQKFRGQREPDERLKDVPFDFDGKSILDLGSNQGGMLFSLADKIKSGIGVDFDYKMVNAANRICRNRHIQNIDFYVFDLERENLQVLRNFLTGGRVDIVFLLAVCMWIKNWRQVIDLSCTLSENLLFESNGSDLQQKDQEEYLRTKYHHVSKIRDASADDPADLRKLFLCRN